MLELPLPTDELARRLSHSLAPQLDRMELTVAALALVGADGDTRPVLRLRVEVTERGSHTMRETWEVTILLDPTDLDPAVNLSSFLLVVRANLEEWWHVKDREPPVAALGRRLAWRAIC